MKVQLVIELDQATGELRVSGPIQDKILAYGMMELARDVVAAQQAAPKLTIVQGMPPMNGAS